VIDTGIDYTHPDIKDNMWVNQAEAQGQAGVDDDNNGYVDDVYGFNFVDANKPTANPMDDHGHGTHCSGTIGGRGNDGTGVVGVNWNVKLMAVKFLGGDGGGTLEGAIKGIDYATKMGAKIMSNSWGGGGQSDLLKQAIERANAAGVLFVAAAGNDSSNNDELAHYPSSYKLDNVISVAALDRHDRLPAHADAKSQLFLRHTALKTKAADVVVQDGGHGLLGEKRVPFLVRSAEAIVPF
jgi:subtilisin family serine protease